MSTDNPTADDFIKPPSNLGATTYIEVIIVDKYSVTTTGYSTDCGRACGHVHGFKFKRDLYMVSSAPTIKALLNLNGKATTRYVPYYRNFSTNALTLANMSDPTINRRNIVFVNVDITPGELTHAMSHIRNTREILASRIL